MANIWDEVEEVQEVQNTPQQQPTNDIWGEVEEVSTQPNLRLTGGVEKYNESANPARNAIRQIGRNTARFILPKKAENWFLGSKEDEEFLKKYNDDNVMSYEDAATLYKQGLLSKDEFMKNTGLRLKLDSLKADAEYRDVRNTNIGKGAVDIGTAAIPFGGGGKVATTVAGKLTPYLGKKIATEAAKGAIIGGKAGLAHGVGYGLVDEDINPLTQGLVEGGIGLVGGGLLGAGAGKLGRTLRAKDIAKRRAIPLADRMTGTKPQVSQEVVEQPIQQVDEVVESVPQQLDEVIPEQVTSDFNNKETDIIEQAKKQILENDLPSYDDAYIYSDNGHGYLRVQIENMRDVNDKYTTLLKNLEEQKNSYLAKAKSEKRIKEINDAYNQRVKEANDSFKISQQNIIKNIDNYKKEIDIIPEQVVEVKTLPQMSDNYLKDLNNYSDTLYRETNADGVLDLIDPNTLSDTSRKEVYFSNNKDLALGQGENKGILLEFNSKGLQGQVNTQKPTWQSEWQNNNAEFIGKFNNKNSYINNVKSVTIKNGADINNPKGKRLLNQLENGNWQKELLENGDVKYTKVVEDTAKMVSGKTKARSLPQSVSEAKGTPKEVKDIIKENPATYEVLKNKDLTEQASKELAGNFDNELIRLSSAKDFDALDYEKSRQIAKNLFSMGKYQQAVDLIDNVSENATKKGQAIQALSLWSNMTPEGAVYKAQKLVREYNKKHPKKQIQLTDENIETIANLQQEALNTTDEIAKNQALARTAKYTADLIPKEALQKLKAYRNIALLLNPKTLGRNIVGNALFNAIDTGAKALAVPIDRAIGLIPDNRFFNTVAKTRVAPSLKTYGKGLVEGAKTGYQEALQGIDTRGLGQRFDLGSGRTFQSKPMQALETVLDVGLRTPDRAFYEATFAESVDNIMRARGLTQPTQEILEQAEQEALEAVFQNQSKLSDAALKTRRALNTLGTNDFGLGDVLIPYAQTPANLAQQGINYSPFGAIKGIANLAQGNQRQASLDFARSLLGTGLIGGGYGLSKAGLMTPSQFDENYQTNKKIRENLQPLGIRPDQIGDMWYAPFQPMSIPLAVGNAAAYGKDPLQAGINTVVDLPFLQGISRGLRDLQEGNYAQAGINVASSIPSQFVPTLGSQFAQTIDPYQRETYDPNKLKYGLNSAIAKIPFASKTLPEKIDVTGQPIERYSTKGGQKLFDIFLNPTFINKKTTDPVLSELKYIYDQTKETSHFMPSVDKKLEFVDVDGNPQKIVLTGREFSEYQRRLGQRMYDEFNYVMDLPEYANADEYGKIKILENAKKLVKAEVDNEMWNKRNRNKKRSYTGGN